MALPPGWEAISMGEGNIVYLDHINREAHEDPPGKVWQQRAAKAAANTPPEGSEA